MNQETFKKLSQDLVDLTPKIPLKWGKIQNNKTDFKLDMFSIFSFTELEQHIKNFNKQDQDYFKRRWFLWQCSRCDEYLLCQNPNVTQNPNSYDQDYDVEFNHNPKSRFDLKGTVVPKRFRTPDLDLKSKTTIKEVIKFYYEKQSKGVRDNIQNRLFVIHHSEVAQERSLLLRSNFQLKKNAFKAYAKRVELPRRIFRHEKVKCDVINIVEKANNELEYFFFK